MDHDDNCILEGYGNLEKLQAIISAVTPEQLKTLLSQKDSSADTALHLAVYWDKPQCVEVLVMAGADVNAVNDEKETPLIRFAKSYSATNDNLSSVHTLLKAGANINAVDENSATALMWAAYNDKPALVDLLIKSGADISLVSETGRTALGMAEACENDDCIAILKAAQAAAGPISYQSYPDNRLLEAFLSDDSDSDTLRKIIDTSNPEQHPAFLAHADEEGNTTLHHAAGRNDLVTIQLLLSAGANVNAVNGAGSTPLMAACKATYSSMKPAAIPAVLLAAGANVNAVDGNGNSALIFAANGRKTEVVECLLKAGADPCHQNAGGSSALDVAADKYTKKILTKAVETAQNQASSSSSSS